MERRRRTAPRLAGLLACAAVPAMLLAGCSSGSGSSGSSDSAGATTSATTPAVAAGKFGTLPASCKTLTRNTVSALVPKAKVTSGTETPSSDISTRGGCSWTGNGTDGYHYSWLSVTLQRFTSSAQLGTAEDQAKKRFADEVGRLGAARGFTTSPVAGVGDQASSISGKATVAGVTSQNSTLVARTANVVLIVEFDGAGLENKKNPGAYAVTSGAQRAAKDAVASVAAANAGANGSAGGSSGASASSSASASGGLSG
jgi:hypothetical protein